MFVEGFDSVFKCSKFDHGVWDLSEPERANTFVKAVNTFTIINDAETFRE